LTNFAEVRDVTKSLIPAYNNYAESFVPAEGTIRNAVKDCALFNPVLTDDGSEDAFKQSNITFDLFAQATQSVADALKVDFIGDMITDSVIQYSSHDMPVGSSPGIPFKFPRSMEYSVLNEDGSTEFREFTASKDFRDVLSKYPDDCAEMVDHLSNVLSLDAHNIYLKQEMRKKEKRDKARTFVAISMVQKLAAIQSIYPFLQKYAASRTTSTTDPNIYGLSQFKGGYESLCNRFFGNSEEQIKWFEKNFAEYLEEDYKSWDRATRMLFWFFILSCLGLMMDGQPGSKRKFYLLMNTIVNGMVTVCILPTGEVIIKIGSQSSGNYVTLFGNCIFHLFEQAIKACMILREISIADTRLAEAVKATLFFTKFVKLVSVIKRETPIDDWPEMQREFDIEVDHHEKGVTGYINWLLLNKINPTAILGDDVLEAVRLFLKKYYSIERLAKIAKKYCNLEVELTKTAVLPYDRAVIRYHGEKAQKLPLYDTHEYGASIVGLSPIQYITDNGRVRYFPRVNVIKYIDTVLNTNKKTYFNLFMTCTSYVVNTAMQPDVLFFWQMMRYLEFRFYLEYAEAETYGVLDVLYDSSADAAKTEYKRIRKVTDYLRIICNLYHLTPSEYARYILTMKTPLPIVDTSLNPELTEYGAIFECAAQEFMLFMESIVGENIVYSEEFLNRMKIEVEKIPGKLGEKARKKMLMYEQDKNIPDYQPEYELVENFDPYTEWNGVKAFFLDTESAMWKDYRKTFNIIGKKGKVTEQNKFGNYQGCVPSLVQIAWVKDGKKRVTILNLFDESTYIHPLFYAFLSFAKDATIYTYADEVQNIALIGEFYYFEEEQISFELTFCDLQQWYMDNHDNIYRGMYDAVKTLLNKRILKDQTESNWLQKLTDDQKRYAAYDALVLIDLLEKITPKEADAYSRQVTISFYQTCWFERKKSSYQNSSKIFTGEKVLYISNCTYPQDDLNFLVYFKEEPELLDYVISNFNRDKPKIIIFKNFQFLFERYHTSVNDIIQIVKNSTIKVLYLSIVHSDLKSRLQGLNLRIHLLDVKFENNILTSTTFVPGTESIIVYGDVRSVGLTLDSSYATFLKENVTSALSTSTVYINDAYTPQFSFTTHIRKHFSNYNINSIISDLKSTTLIGYQILRTIRIGMTTSGYTFKPGLAIDSINDTPVTIAQIRSWSDYLVTVDSSHVLIIEENFINRDKNGEEFFRVMREMYDFHSNDYMLMRHPTPLAIGSGMDDNPNARRSKALLGNLPTTSQKLLMVLPSEFYVDHVAETWRSLEMLVDYCNYGGNYQVFMFTTGAQNKNIERMCSFIPPTIRKRVLKSTIHWCDCSWTNNVDHVNLLQNGRGDGPGSSNPVQGEKR